MGDHSWTPGAAGMGTEIDAAKREGQYTGDCKA